MKIYNTMSKRKEEFVPLEEGKVKMYVCGPTVYNYIHIGNARPMIVFDTVRRYFEYKNYDVNYVSNFTDVDDKIIKKANEEGVTAEEISQRYIAECKKDMDGIPKRGFHNIFAKPLESVNVSALEKFEDGAVVDAKALLDAGILSKCTYGVKILGNGEITKKLTVKASAFSESAKAKIEAAGGKAEVV